MILNELYAPKLLLKQEKPPKRTDEASFTEQKSHVVMATARRNKP